MYLLTFLAKALELRRNEGLTRVELETMQAAKLRRLATFAFRRSAYYRDVMHQRAIDPAACHIDQFPVLTKRDVLDNFDRIATDPRVTSEGVKAFLATSTNPTELMGGRFHVVHTSGSSGEVGIFVYSRDDWARGLAQASRLHAMGLRRQRIAYFGAVQGHFAGVSLMSSGMANVARTLYDTLICDINTPLAPVVEQLNRFQPHLLGGYATGLKILAEQQREGRLRITPGVLHSSGEPLVPDDRALLEETFGAPCLNIYATTEHLVMGASAPDGRGIRLFEDDLIFEMHPDCTYVTNLFNFTLPLIRYKLSDIMTALPTGEANGPHRRVNEIVGRSEVVPWFRNEAGDLDFVSPLVIVGIYVPGIRRFQMELIDEQSFVFRYCVEPGLTEEVRLAARNGLQAKLADILRHKRMANVRVEIVGVEDLPVDPRAGKFKFIRTKSAFGDML
jgi:phenylacetate-coenzyme A ligase PaaK-like adenylate-forming protein